MAGLAYLVQSPRATKTLKMSWLTWFFVLCLLEMERHRRAAITGKLLYIIHCVTTQLSCWKQQLYDWRIFLAVLHPDSTWMYQHISRYKFLENSSRCALFRHLACSCQQLLWAAAGSVPLPPQHGWATHWCAGCVTALLCGVLCQTGKRGDAEEASANRREVQRTLDLDGKCCELIQSLQIPMQPNLTLVHTHVRTHTQPQTWVSWKQTMVNGDSLEVILSTRKYCYWQ